VDKVAARHGTTEAAKAYLSFLYTEEGQEIGAKELLPAAFPAALAKYPNRLPEPCSSHHRRTVRRWQKAQKRHL